MKRSLTAVDFAALLREGLNGLEGLRLQKAWMLGEAVVARFREPALGDRYLVLSPCIGVFETRYELPRGEPVKQLAAVLRELRGARLTCIRQVGLDRVAVLTFDKGGGRVEIVAEWVREGNLIALNGGGRVTALLRAREMRDRRLAIGELYEPPPPRGLDPLSLTHLDVPSPNARLTVAALLSRTVNAPGELLAEAAYRAGVDPNVVSNTVPLNALSRALVELKKLILKVLKGELEPCVALEEGEVAAAYPIKLKHVTLKLEPSTTFAEAVDRLLTKLLIQVPATTSGAAVEAEQFAHEYAERSIQLKRAAEVIMSDLARFEMLLKEFKILRESVQWDLLKGKLSEKYPEIIAVDPPRMLVKMLVNGVEVDLNANLSAARNASLLYEEAKEFERKAEKAKEVAARLGLKSPELPSLKLRKERSWFESFHHFFSSEGFLVIGGRDASQNEAIVRKYMQVGDLFFHAEIHGGPVVIVKSEGKQVGEATIREAAQLAAIYSKAWEAGLTSVDVYWVNSDQVSKKAPAGEYIKKGAFMVYGKRNYIKSVKLELAIGVEVEGGVFKLLAGPLQPLLSKCKAAVILEPGRLKREETAEKVAKRLSSALMAKGLKARIQPSEVLALLPRGGFHISRVVEIG
ncbi:MAG: ribosome rescue protein RqcH [Thermofilaceae archaeon]